MYNLRMLSCNEVFTPNLYKAQSPHSYQRYRKQKGPTAETQIPGMERSMQAEHLSGKGRLTAVWSGTAKKDTEENLSFFYFQGKSFSTVVKAANKKSPSPTLL
jgi:hypothetical protein